eukprot:gene5195-biopygen5174
MDLDVAEWVPRMDLDVAEWVKTCVTCQQAQPRQGYPMGLLQPHRVPSKLSEVVSIDFVTGLPTTQRGVNAFTTFICKLSKMAHDNAYQEFMRLLGVKRRLRGFSPFELVYGHAPTTQLDFFMDAALEGGSRRRKGGRVAADKRGTAHQLAKQFAQQLQAARVNLQMVRQRMMEQFDARHRVQQTKVNDQ